MRADPDGSENGDPDLFTDKQCQVLDLLIEHKTSKEIARELGISPYTVDQRISLARAKLGAGSRNELAARYRAMRDGPETSAPENADTSPAREGQAVYQGPVYNPAPIDPAGNQVHSSDRKEDEVRFAPAADAHKTKHFPTDTQKEYRVVPEVFEGRSGDVWRLGAVVATAFLLVVLILGLFAIFAQLNDMLG